MLFAQDIVTNAGWLSYLREGGSTAVAVFLVVVFVWYIDRARRDDRKWQFKQAASCYKSQLQNNITSLEMAKVLGQAIHVIESAPSPYAAGSRRKPSDSQVVRDTAMDKQIDSLKLELAALEAENDSEDSGDKA